MSGRRVLVVEDEMLVAMMIEDMLVELGFEIVGPATRLQRALDLAQGENFDFAVLDINLANERSFPVATVLRERGIPFVFATGYGSPGLNDSFQGTTTLQKPFEQRQLESAISTALSYRSRN
jgi:CheY-like chemotaxis protein